MSRMPQLRWEPSPILVKELRSTMRSGRSFAALTLFLLFLAGVSVLVYLSVIQSSNGRITPSSDAGRTIFGVLSFLELLLLAFTAPALTAGSVAGEYQRQTFDMLMSTPLTTRQILVGKFFSALSFLGLLMLAAIPINYVAFLFGGVGSDAILWWVFLQIAVVFLLGALGMMMSTIFRSPNIANVVTYGTVLGFGVVLPLLALFLGLFFGFGGTSSWAECTAAAVYMFHPAGSLLTIIAPLQENLEPIRILPATILLYIVLGIGCLLIGESRLAKMAGRPSRVLVWQLILGLIAIGTAIYLFAEPVTRLCSPESFT